MRISDWSSDVCSSDLNKWNLVEIVESAKVPIIVDAGVGTASDAAIAMELGCDGVLMNTAIAGARDPVLMAHAMKLAIEAGRAALDRKSVGAGQECVRTCRSRGSAGQ